MVNGMFVPQEYDPATEIFRDADKCDVMLINLMTGCSNDPYKVVANGTALASGSRSRALLGGTKKVPVEKGEPVPRKLLLGAREEPGWDPGNEKRKEQAADDKNGRALSEKSNKKRDQASKQGGVFLPQKHVSSHSSGKTPWWRVVPRTLEQIRFFFNKHARKVDFQNGESKHLELEEADFSGSASFQRKRQLQNPGDTVVYTVAQFKFQDGMIRNNPRETRSKNFREAATDSEARLAVILQNVYDNHAQYQGFRVSQVSDVTVRGDWTSDAFSRNSRLAMITFVLAASFLLNWA